ncbi:hypothetical protein HanRHA438_Chr01g0044371 [Helianthus annuus]|nr:hypothetical protein HanRHA438_Chr01g0044371 [Helianthus annuus]
MEWGIMSPCGDFSSMPSPVPLTFEDPSVCSIQGSLVSSSCWTSNSASFCRSLLKSATKSASAWDLMAVLGSYLISWALSFTAHLAILPDISGFLRTFLIGKLVLTTIVWVSK